MSGLRVTFEDGHSEDFAANNVIYANAGGLILNQIEVKDLGLQFNPQTGDRQRAYERSESVVALISAPRPDMPAADRWRRVESVPPEPVEPELVTLADGRREPNESVLSHSLSKEAN